IAVERVELGDDCDRDGRRRRRGDDGNGHGDRRGNHGRGRPRVAGEHLQPLECFRTEQVPDRGGPSRACHHFFNFTMLTPLADCAVVLGATIDFPPMIATGFALVGFAGQMAKAN
ncbi:MAG: hypothetical protein ACK55I_11675, partial [bacterium]